MTDQQLKAFGTFVRQWPAGRTVWHRGSGARGVVLGWTLRGDGGMGIRVDYGACVGEAETPAVLSATKVSDGHDGEDWKEGANQE